MGQSAELASSIQFESVSVSSCLCCKVAEVYCAFVNLTVQTIGLDSVECENWTEVMSPYVEWAGTGCNVASSMVVISIRFKNFMLIYFPSFFGYIC
ncbi:MAG: hypothetical protein LBJ95_03655 [Oscillospiraceae bacterium]|nr:hypothetical protein [Oscillospiraceae bacterium]